MKVRTASPSAAAGTASWGLLLEPWCVEGGVGGRVGEDEWEVGWEVDGSERGETLLVPWCGIG